MCALWQVLCWAHGARKLLGPREDDGDEGDNNDTNIYWVRRKGKAPFSKLSTYLCVSPSHQVLLLAFFLQTRRLRLKVVK